MQQKIRYFAIAGVFLTWVLPRVLPLLLYPGVFCFDTWYFMGYAESILPLNHIPPLNPFEYYYISHPALYLFAVQITHFFGIPLIEAFRVFAVILIIVGFLAFFALFHNFLGDEWASIIAMLLFAIAVDVVAQTNCVIQENMALIFLALIILLTFKVMKLTKQPWYLILPIFMFVLVFTHHLTTYFAILFSIALLFASLISQNRCTRKIGTLLGATLTILLLLLLLIVNPIMQVFFLRYYYITIPVFVVVTILCSILVYFRQTVWKFFTLFQKKGAKPTFTVLGLLCGMGFFFTTILFYPYDRTLFWIIFKFGLFSLLLGLSIAAIRVFPWVQDRKHFIGLFIFVSIIILGLSFSYSGIFTLLYVAQEVSRIEVAIGHRHFTFLLIPFAVASSLVIIGLYKGGFKSQQLSNRLLFSSLVLVILIFSLGGVTNLYFPSGGWYPEYCDHAEINTGLWLQTTTNPQSTITTDRRLIQMMEGMYPIGSNRFNLQWLNLSYLTNPRLVLNYTKTNRENIYFFTSSLSEANYILEFLQPPLQIPCSELLNNQNSVAKIYAQNNAETYWLIQN